MQITPKQIKMARMLLDWSQADLAEKSSVSRHSIIGLESEKSSLQQSNYEKIILAIESSGVEFTEGNGVRERSSLLKYTGQEGFRSFMDDVYEVANTVGSDICLFNARPANWIKWLEKDWYEMHSQRMQKIRQKAGFTFRVTSQKGDYSFIGGKFGEYRWVPDKLFNQDSVYIYGDRLALMDFSDDNVRIFVLYKQAFADSFREMFEYIWQTTTEIPDSDDHKFKE